MIPVARPDVGDRELEQIREALETGWIGLGPKVEEFEAAFGEKFGYDNVVATNAGTSALDLALKAADTNGSEVLVPPITWISTAFIATYNRFNVGWVDVNPKTLNMDPKALRRRITDDTAAVVVVHYGGQPAEINRLVDVAREHDAVVIEDCAHAVGTEFQGEQIGTIGDIGCFSFQATKPLTTGEGGALVTDDANIGDRVRRMSKLGVDKSTHERSDEGGYSWYYEVTDVGYKYFMNDIAAGMGLVQLERLSETRKRRTEVAEAYADAFAGLDWVEPLRVKDHITHAWYNYSVRVPANHREEIIQYLGERGVGSSVHYMPLYKHPVFEDHNPRVPATEAVWEQVLTLPMSSTFSEEEIQQVTDAVAAYSDNKNLEEPKPVPVPGGPTG